MEVINKNFTLYKSVIKLKVFHRNRIAHCKLVIIIFSVCLDTSECGDLESCNLVGEYEKTYQYVTLTKEDLLNYSINVYNDGNLLEIVSICCKLTNVILYVFVNIVNS